ncbi:CusA/CzcA family heavy metal efflux RND transporter [Parvibaculum sp.]|jgi:Cu(I)/Ag(I) efflux system membrane protein CusA/SilA|uniref:CusA/CzcA family heavy metal efflux RND transporter n=2 Tax=Parvibaculum sp. TaxID=2024848 RepID=UPI000C4A8DB7|nr:CusA/CzcA family heavy metal efflux RND transporter [Parvibaculum sp.]MAU61746.1 CusA/CzcA family heavy metal efflux RND transporter [Parvibaculum sp.]MBO6678006.1 efflux RND transporter permease subunit [Parvibaculum sp.]MBO6683339.1 efflux RND transporter permease subunit [Parvibaculum sp.]MBO6903581.1 efflux RND transporter permease subunit [Parvibaculum sp.]|tara:strand:+ start:146 stop:3280 length:3135 start_codon:yes stop_codon:yes gene_type:complete
MIAGIIGWSARNSVLVLIGTLFAIVAGIYSIARIPLDAIPDLSDTQVIIVTDYPGQAPQVVEDQVTFPLATAMLNVPRARVVRGFSFFGVSFVYVVFEDGADLYWARSRVLEYLSAAAERLPDGVTPSLGPDATGVGWVYQYALKSSELNLAELRSLQDWQVRFAVSRAEGVAEVATVGGFVRQYAVIVDPLLLKSTGLTLSDIAGAVRTSNMDVGGRTIELAETEFMIRGRGYLAGIEDIEKIVLRAEGGTPLLLRDVARVELAPDERRGVAEMGGEGEAVSGIALQRHGANALDVIENVKRELAAVAPSLPGNTEIVEVYDRSALIGRAINTLVRTLVEESVVVALVCFMFLWHARSALVAIVTLPVGILMALAATHVLSIPSNIMSLGGIAIAIGAMVDAAIVMIENAHKRLEHAPPGASRTAVVIEAAQEVGPALFFSLLIITVSFLPIFTLEAQEGRLFKPLAATKTFAMAAAALLSITLVPVLMTIFIRGRIVPEDQNPLNKALIWLYRPVIGLVLRARGVTILAAFIVLAVTAVPLSRIGSEFMPNLNEGTLLYMPTTLPGLSVTKAAELLQTQNRIIAGFPEVASVWGKAGRADSATDPAPMEMFETIINLKPESDWRQGMNLDKLIAEMDTALQFPGVSNAWTMPIKARIDMLSTGIRTPVGVKIFGPDLVELERIAREIETVLRAVPGTSSAYAERVNGGYFLDIRPDRDRIARHGLSMETVQETIAMALGAKALTTTVEGRERYDVVLRYPQASRADPDALAREVFVTTPAGAAIPLGEIADIARARGPTMVRTESGQPVVYVFVDIRDRDLGGYVGEARRVVAGEVALPPGYTVAWSGQFEYLARAQQRLSVVIPVTLLVIFLLLYLNFKGLTETFIVMLSLPFALVGGLWLMAALDFNMSVAAAVGFIALAGVAAETGVVMLLYLDQALRDAKALVLAKGRAFTRADLNGAIMEGAVGRVRPKMMTVITIMAGLLPILWATGTGAEVMQRIAVPMIGGMVSSTILTLVVIPAIYAIVHGMRLSRGDASTVD